MIPSCPIRKRFKIATAECILLVQSQPCQRNPAWTRNANVHLTRLLLEAVLHTSAVAMQVQLIETSRFHGPLSWLWLPKAVLFQMGRLGRLSHNGFSMVFPIIQWISVDHFGVPRKYGDPNWPKYRRAAVVDRSKGHLGCDDHWQEFQEATWPVDPHPGCSSWSALCYFFLVDSRSVSTGTRVETLVASCRCVFCYTSPVLCCSPLDSWFGLVKGVRCRSFLGSGVAPIKSSAKQRGC